MISIEGLSPTLEEQELIARSCVGGVILFSRNYADKAQLRDLVASLRAVNPTVLIAVDQEGGRVQRFREGFLSLPALSRLGALYAADQEAGLAAAEACGWAMAVEQVDVGIDFSFAPVLDVYNAASRVIADRAFAADPEVLSALALRYVAGMNAAGMAATGKHFPGHGTVAADSHVELPIDTRPLDALFAHDLKPFEALASSLGGVMPAHVIYSAVDPHCAGFSRFWLQDILRKRFGFDGVIFSDDLTMDAAHSAGSVEVRADLALEAGCDMVLVCNDGEAARRVADHIDARADSGVPPSASRLPRMAAQFDRHDADYASSSRWREAQDIIASLPT
jgi:beta-N-acetylhexosaminidase